MSKHSMWFFRSFFITFVQCKTIDWLPSHIVWSFAKCKNIFEIQMHYCLSEEQNEFRKIVLTSINRFSFANHWKWSYNHLNFFLQIDMLTTWPFEWMFILMKSALYRHTHTRTHTQNCTNKITNREVLQTRTKQKKSPPFIFQSWKQSR